MIEDQIQQLRGRKANILDHQKSFQSSVLLPVVKIDDELQVLFEKRSADLKLQPGEICFPGGKIEKGETSEETVLRETCEELGLSSNDIEILAPLDIMVSPFNAIIYPYIGIIDDPSKIEYNPDEVEQIFFVPLSFFLLNSPKLTKLHLQIRMPDDYPFELVPYGKNYPYREGVYPQQFYVWEDKVIWGLTARILYHFLSLLK
ncbi:MAG: CoA pyrophosphatase [Bacillota bacterium]|nr:CoA pyrophosphatase [Bacillota bacterium]